jgi:divalent metal cation (Fe/Co/Zn/Cd) transporter
VAADHAAIEALALQHTGAPPLDVAFRDSERGRIALVTVALSGERTLRDAHRIAGRIEEDLRRERPALADAVVHTEPG